MTKIRFSIHFQCYEILIAEIFEIKPNEEQLSELKTLMAKESNEYLWAKEDQIFRRGAISGGNSNYTISETAEWVL
jgi:TorA maturation chaperone TorD